MKIAGLFALLAVAACSPSGQTIQSAPPSGHSIQGETNLARLLAAVPQGVVSPTPWSGSWYAYSNEGIADSASLYEQAFGQNGAADWELAHHGSTTPGILEWFGHCNGWAAAASLYPEPRAPKSAGGVTFAAADQKALLSEIAMEVRADFFGTRNDDNDPQSASFQDIFPDQFFLVLTNLVGHGRPLVMDRYTGNQVWNQAIAGYRISPVTPADYLGKGDDTRDIYRVQLTTQVWWLRDDVSADHLTEPFEFADGPSYDSRMLRFELWLDGPVSFDESGDIASSGNIVVARDGATVVGGDWQEGEMDIYNSHPDYVWIPYSIAKSTGLSNPLIAADRVLSIR